MLSIKEKRDMLINYCNNTPCSKCKLNIGGWKKTCDIEECLVIDYSDEEDLNRAIKLIENADAPVDDNVNHPKHYTDGKIEVIEFIEDKKLDFCLGNAVKYIARAGKKDPAKEVEDLKKARWYIERRIKELTEASENA